ncbi:MAG: hypothetical protein OXL41_15735 [Nitrospinae bacterium]|nr:hypothetical protein [Nitrospinota bacterium]
MKKEQKWNDLGRLLKNLYQTVAELETLFPNRKFTLDGHLAGSIGEVIAAYVFDLKLLENSTQTHDAKAKQGTLVQIKFTQGNKSVAISSEPEHLIVLRLTSEHALEIVYNGPGAKPWQKAGKLQRNGQKQISLSLFRKIDKDVVTTHRLPVVKKLDFRVAS